MMCGEIGSSDEGAANAELVKICEMIINYLKEDSVDKDVLVERLKNLLLRLT
jgi:hypothetical protein